MDNRNVLDGDSYFTVTIPSCHIKAEETLNPDHPYTIHEYGSMPCLRPSYDTTIILSDIERYRLQIPEKYSDQLRLIENEIEYEAFLMFRPKRNATVE